MRIILCRPEVWALVYFYIFYLPCLHALYLAFLLHCLSLAHSSLTPDMVSICRRCASINKASEVWGSREWDGRNLRWEVYYGRKQGKLRFGEMWASLWVLPVVDNVVWSQNSAVMECCNLPGQVNWLIDLNVSRWYWCVNLRNSRMQYSYT